MTLWHYYFHWFDGQIWPNFIVDALFSICTTMVGYFKLKKLHNRHHEDLKQHITEQINIDRTSI